MESPCAGRFFRQLFLYSTYQCLKQTHVVAPLMTKSKVTSRSVGQYSKFRRKEPTEVVPWQQRTEILPEDRSAEFSTYGVTTADELRLKNRKPRRVKMLIRDFIEDSLYNDSYGYFSKQAVIFNPGEPFDFNAMRDGAEFQKTLGDRYKSFEDNLDDVEPTDTRQVWHTPTELFRPYYAEAMARYFVTNYRISLYPYHDLIIYELGAGNGTFMLNVLDYIRDTDPEVYARTKYKVVEISSALAALQNERIQNTAESRAHGDKVEIINRSIFNWDIYVSSPCFFLALEVIDNFAHDIIRYDLTTEKPYQGSVLIDTQGDFYEFYSSNIDPLAARFFRVREAACSVPYRHPLRGWGRLRNILSKLSFAPNMSEPEYIPTRLMQFFDILHRYFPAHRLLTSDFHSLPDSVPGINAPVVQTRYKRRTVTVTTPLVRQGYFDILFPTDFQVMEEIYRAITGKLTRVVTHEEFMNRWAYVDETKTRNGESPLLIWYANASVMTTL